MRYILNILIAIDQLFNASFAGNPDETISSRLGKCAKWICKAICRILDFFEKDHCVKSIENIEHRHEK